MLVSESHLIANRTVIAMLALCTLGMAFLFRIAIIVLVNQRLKDRRGNNESEAPALVCTHTAGPKCGKGKGQESIRLRLVR
jgi:hypothetical protein